VQGNTTQMLPAEIGHAAAYEAYRTWIHNSSIYEPLSGDIERQREGLIGLAIAEGELTLVFLIGSLTNPILRQSLDSYSLVVVHETTTAA
jgi:hypothetical protein